MKLRLIYEADHRALMGLYGRDRLGLYKDRLRRAMPAAKRKHSLRVGNTLAGLSRDRDVIDAGLFHDYVERGGDIRRAATALGFSARTVRLINLLSDENKQEGGSVLGHMKEILAEPGLDEETRNQLVIIKLADRLDNLQRRLDDRRLDDSYLRRSEKLARWLLGHYSGDPEYIKLLRGRMAELGVKIKKSHVGRRVRREDLAGRPGLILGM